MANVGTAKVSIEADFSNFSKDMDAFFGKAGKNAGKALDDGVSGGAKSAEKAAEGVGKAAQKAGNDADKALSDAGAKGGKAMADNLGKAGKAAQDAGKDAAKAFDQVPQEAQKAGAAAATGFRVSIAPVGEASQSAAATASRALADIGAKGSQAGSQAATGYSSAISGIGNSSASVASAATRALSGIGAAGTKAGASAATGFSSSVQGMVPSAGSVANAVTRSLDNMAAKGSTVGSRISTGFYNGIGGVVSAAASTATAAGNALQGVVGSAQRVASSVKTTLTDAFQSTHAPVDAVPGKIMAIGAALGAVAGPMAMFKGGFDRLMGIQRSEIIFKNIGLSADETAAQMSKLSDQVTGTSLSLADAAQRSAAFAQAGVQLGKPMDDAVNAFAALSAAAGDSGVDVGMVMQQISAQGKITGGDMMQLSGAGINAAAWLADEMGISMSEVSDAVSGGEVDFDTFVRAVNKGAGSLAKDMGQTLPAKIANFKTAVSNMGATLIEPLIGPFTAMVDKAIWALKAAKKPVQEFFDFLAGGSVPAQILTGAMAVLGTTMAVGVAGGMLTAVKASGLLTKALKILNVSFITSGPGLIILAILAVVATFVILWKKCEWFRDFWKGLWDQITSGVSDAWNRISPIFDTLRAAWDELTAAFSGGDWGYGALESLFGEGAAQGIVNAMAGIGDAVRTAWEWIKRLGGVLLDVGKSVASSGLEAGKAIFEGIWAVVKSLFGAVVQIGKAFWDLAQVLAPVLWPVLKVIGAVVGGVLVGAFFALMGALKLVAAVVKVVATVIGWLAENVLSPLISVLGTVASFLIDVLGGAFQWLFDTVSTIASGLATAFSAMWGFLQAAWETVGQPILDFIVAAFQFFWDALMLGFRLLGATFQVIWTGLGLAWTTFGQPIVDLILAAFRFLWSGVEVIFGWIMTGWNILWAGVQAVYNNVIKPVLDWISNAFQWVKDRISSALGIVGDKIREVGQWISDLYGKYVKPMVDRVIRGFDRIKDTVMGWKDKIIGVLSDAGSWLIDTGKNIVQGLLDGIGSLAGKIGDFFLDKIPGWIKGPFKKALGIKSPSRVFAGYGRNIGEGLVRGVDAMQGKVQKATQGLAEAAGNVDLPTLSVGAEVNAPVAAPSVPSPAVSAPGGVGVGGADPVAGEAVSDEFAVAAAGMSATAESVLTPLWAQQNTDMTLWGQTALTQASTVVSPALSSVGLSALTMQATQWTPAMMGITSSMTSTAAVTAQQAGGVINPALNSVAATTWNVLNTGVNPAMAGMRGAALQTANTFGQAAAMIGQQWNAVREGTAKPVRFAIQSVFNDGIVGMWNSVSEMLGTDRMNPYPVRFATGGYVRGPGGPKDDKIPALLSNKEFVINATATKAIGPKNLAALNSGRLGVADGVLQNPAERKAMFRDKTFQRVASRYQTGGIAKGTPAWKDLLRGYEWARQRNGRPYVWGGSANGSGGADCSGFMSGIADVILGGSGARQWTTYSFPGGQPFVPGLASGFAVGVSSEHTAGTIGGVEGIPAVNVESGGINSRMKFGTSDAAGADDSQFPRKAHLAYTGDGRFMPGAGGGASMGQIISNMTAEHAKRIQSAAAGFSASHPGLMNTYPEHLATTLTKATQAKIDKLVEEMMQFAVGNADSYRGMIKAAYRRQGFQWSQAKEDAWVRQIQSESSGNPNAVQNGYVDVNTGGNEAKGLLQIAGSTWPGCRDPELPDNIFDPWANINAAIRYAERKYGANLLNVIGHGHGYDLGGYITDSGLFSTQTTEAERVLSPRQTRAFDELVDILGTPGWDDFATAVTGARRPATVGGGGSVRTHEVTQNFYGQTDPEKAGDAVENRLSRKAW